MAHFLRGVRHTIIRSPSLRKEAVVRQSDRELPDGMRKRIGNFTRIFPFNDVTCEDPTHHLVHNSAFSFFSFFLSYFSFFWSLLSNTCVRFFILLF